jgi:hypothetical protein
MGFLSLKYIFKWVKIISHNVLTCSEILSMTPRSFDLDKFVSQTLFLTLGLLKAFQFPK